jgi:hypothetical protein
MSDIRRHILYDSEVRQRKKCMPHGMIRVTLKNNGKQEMETPKTKGER